MRYYIITDKKVYNVRSLKQLNKQHNLKLEQTDFIPCGSDYICKMTDKDIDIALDAKRLSLIPINALFKKDKGNLMPLLIIILLQIINLAN